MRAILLETEELDGLIRNHDLSVQDAVEYLFASDALDPKLFLELKAASDGIFDKIMRLRNERKRKEKAQEFIRNMTEVELALVKGRPVFSVVLWEASHRHMGAFLRKIAEDLSGGRDPSAESLPLNSNPHLMSFIRWMQFREYRALREKEESREHPFESYRVAALRWQIPNRPGIQMEYVYDCLSPCTLKITPYFDQFGSMGMNSGEAKERLSRRMNVCIFRLTLVDATGTHEMFGSLSRISGELMLGDSMTVSLQPLFQAMGVEGFYTWLKAELKSIIAHELQTGCIIKVPEAESALPEAEGQEDGAAGPVSVQSETQAEVKAALSDSGDSNGVEEQGEGRASRPNGTVRLSALSFQEAEHAFVGLGCSSKDGKKHKVLTRQLPNGRSRVYPIPRTHGSGKATGNPAQIISHALRVLGFTREEFLAAL